jgi:hypothetical protein
MTLCFRANVTPAPSLLVKGTPMLHRSAQIALLLALAALAVAYRLAFIAARRLAVEAPRAHAPATHQQNNTTGRPAGGAV